MKLGLLFTTTIALTQLAMSQNTIGLPEIFNFTKKQYLAGSQNWDVKKDRNGYMYFANNDGLLSFDGIHWKLFSLPNKSIVRSVAIGKDGRVYVGGQEELGYFSPDARGRLSYTSLKSLVPKDESGFADVWAVIPYENAVFFRANRKILRYSQGKITAFNSIDWSFMGESNGQLIAQEYERGLLRYQSGFWVPFLKNGQVPTQAKDNISSMVAIGKDSSLIFTRNNAYILYRDTVAPFLKGIIPAVITQKVYSSARIDEDHIALATNLEGCYIVNRHGEFIQRLARQDGLQNNNILSIFVDEEKNIWLGLDNGIDLIAYDNSIKKIKPDWQNNYAGYTSIIHDNRLYVGTSAGVFFAPLQARQDLSLVQSSFGFVANTKGQVWTLAEVNGKLLMGHNNGAYQIENDRAIPIDPTSGFWTFQPLYNVIPCSRIFAGCYNGINFYDFRDGKFNNPSLHAHFESARYVSNDNGTLWIAHPYKGMYYVTFDSANVFRTNRYVDRKGILSANDNYLFRVNNKTVLCTQKGIYELDPRVNDFVPSTFFTSIFGKAIPSYMREDRNGNIWFVYNKTPGVVDLTGERPVVQYFTELTNKVTSGGYEFIDPVDNNNIFIAGEDGFYHLNRTAYAKKKHGFQTLITSVKAMNKKDSLLYDGYAAASGQLERIGAAWNSFRFEYAATLYGSNNLQYSYRLVGFDKRWSEWTSKSEKEYTNLPAGHYTFEVKSRYSEGHESPSVASYSFVILPPWYQTYPAYFIYFILAIAGVFLLYKVQQKRLLSQQLRYEEEQKRLLYLHQLEIDKAEKELVKLKNEKLEAEIQHKNSELASSTMHLMQKGELLTKIKDKLIRLEKDAEKQKSADEFKTIIKILGQEDHVDANWDQFASHFNEVHGNFLVMLRRRFPDLTPNELKLCAYLRMNMSTKEIAQLMNISVRGVEISRYRLRKKLGLKTSENIFNVLIKIDRDDEPRKE